MKGSILYEKADRDLGSAFEMLALSAFLGTFIEDHHLQKKVHLRETANVYILQQQEGLRPSAECFPLHIPVYRLLQKYWTHIPPQLR